MEQARYSTVAVALHWAIAILILSQIAGGFYMHNLPNSAVIKFDLYQLHKSFGISILALTVVRLAWRVSHRAPALPAAMPGWQKFAARATHWGFYGLLFATPIVGWAMVSVSPKEIPTKWFGLFDFPHLPFITNVADRSAVEDMLHDRHEFLAFTILFLLALHVGAALKHRLINKDGVLRSMTPAGLGAWAGIAVILGGLGAAAVLYVTDTSAPPPSDRESFVERGELIAETPEKTEPSVMAAPQLAPETTAEDDAAEAPPVDDPVAASPRAVAQWTVDYDNSRLGFVGEERGKKFNGAFSNFSAAIEFDPENLEASSISVDVQTGSASTGDELKDSTMPGGEWFNVKNHPIARFQSTAIRSVGENAYVADGLLSIKDINHDATLAFTLDIDGDRALAKGGADLLRTDYGLGEDASWLEEERIGLNVRVEFEITAQRKP